MSGRFETFESIDPISRPPVRSSGPVRTGHADLAALAVAAGLSVLLMFLLWEAIERAFATSTDAAYIMHYARGISSSLVTASVVASVFYRQHRRRIVELNAEIRRRTRELGEARAFLELVFDSTPAALVVIDQHQRVVKANRAAREVHAQDPTGLRCWRGLVDRSEPCETCFASDTLESGTSRLLDAAHVDPRTGEVLAVQSHRLELPTGERHVLLVENRVTEQKKLEARLLHQEKMAAFGLLAAGIAHDMGNPLSSIAAQLQLLDDDTDPAETREVIATVRQETERLRRIVRELVDFARRRRDEASLVSVQAVVTDTLRLIRHDRRMRSVRLIEQYHPETPPVFMIEDHLMQVILNLLINALDAMPDGGSLRVEVKPAPDQVALRIHDTGTGMERHVLQRCFEPLFTTKAPGQGTGLGLSICRDIVEAADGTIELHSAPGQGTTVILALPGATGDQPSSSRSAVAAENRTATLPMVRR